MAPFLLGYNLADRWLIDQRLFAESIDMPHTVMLVTIAVRFSYGDDGDNWAW